MCPVLPPTWPPSLDLYQLVVITSGVYIKYVCFHPPLSLGLSERKISTSSLSMRSSHRFMVLASVRWSVDVLVRGGVTYGVR